MLCIMQDGLRSIDEPQVMGPHGTPRQPADIFFLQEQQEEKKQVKAVEAESWQAAINPVRSRASIETVRQAGRQAGRWAPNSRLLLLPL